MYWNIICTMGIVMMAPGIRGHANNKIPECNRTLAHKGVKLCDEAFERAFNINRDSVMLSPKRHGCCISQNINPCYNYSYTQAKCHLAEHKVAELIAAKQREYQTLINTEANYMGNTNCNYMHWKKCEHLFDEYAKTMYEIEKMNNGVSDLGLSALALILIILKHFTPKSCN